MENIPRSRLIYRGIEQPLPPENRPSAVFDRVFGLTVPSMVDPEVRERLQARHSPYSITYTTIFGAYGTFLAAKTGPS